MFLKRQAHFIHHKYSSSQRLLGVKWFHFVTKKDIRQRVQMKDDIVPIGGRFDWVDMCVE